VTVNAWRRVATAWRGGTGNSVGIVGASLDAFGEPRLQVFGQRAYQPTVDDGPLAANGEGIVGTDFHGMLRHQGLARSAGWLPLTGPWLTTGDVALTREIDPASGGAAPTGRRLRVAPRYGAPLDLRNSDFANQRGIVIDLPVLDSRDDGAIAAATEVLVVARFVDWQRASESCWDPMGLTGGSCGGNGAADASGYLPRVDPGDGYGDVIAERFTWVTIPADGDGDFATGVEGGVRFILDLDDPAHRRVRVLTDRLGVFQAFLRR
jgi:hypothetical protein